LKATQRLTLIAGLVASLFAVGGAATAASAASSETYTWQNAVWGGGGFVTGTLFHPKVQGLVYTRTDVGGMYRRDPGSTKWVSLNDGLTRPDNDLQGVLSIAVDPRDPSRVYSATGMYLPSWGHPAEISRSADRGRTWARTDLPFNLGGR
jgi:hypothetical protein